jgi:transposase
MPQNFLGCDRDQELLLPPSLKEWLPESHLAWFVLEAVGELDLDAFYVAYRQDGWGRAAHDPAMMVALLIYAYAIGVRTSRGIERHCFDDVAFRVIAANQVPDHATIARFRVRHETAIAQLFGGVLELCARAGMVKVGVVAVDGTKVAAAATHHATRTYQQIAGEILQEARRAWTQRRTSCSVTRGVTSCPRGCARAVTGASGFVRPSRRWRPSAPRRPSRSGVTAASACWSARRDLSRTGSLSGASSASMRRGSRAGSPATERGVCSARRTTSSPYPLGDKPAGKINVTDPDSRNLKTTRGWVQGYNAQAVVTLDQIVIAADISTESLDTASLKPMLETATAELQAAGVSEPLGLALADAGYWRNDAIEALLGQGIGILIAPDADRRKEPRPGRRGGRYDFARRVLATDYGKEIYLKRQGSVEPVFGQIKANRGANRFLRRGRSAVRSEWRLLTLTHNILKLHRHHLATA